MKLPEKIKGRNRIRDAAIVLYFKRDGWDYPQIAEKFKLTERRIQQILSKNHAFVKRDKEWEREKRINRLTQWIKTAPKPVKDQLDIQIELRNEIEGDQKHQSNSGDTKIIIIRSDGERVPVTSTTRIAGTDISVIRPSVQEALDADKAQQVSG